ncbi:anion permease [Tepiditoga spiralis]|uniref:Anion permease n=1 Tax=Tepiditoga spiralis TaxID=2108365 RepID=A0A7G1G1Z8_9BACT|nr:inorganic phosphate transporter [Tepiditoga spiralis]BBE30321.1 anion permease [Tepiditoga spiralis]
MIYFLIPAIFLGWSLGSNDAANLFGPPVSSGIIKYKHAIIIASIFVVLGAIIGGAAGLKTIGGLTDINLRESSISLFGAALTVTFMTFLGLPVSTSQAVVGSLVGVGMLRGSVDLSKLIKVVISWVGTPIGALIIAFFAYKIVSYFFRQFLSVQKQDIFIIVGTWAVGIYGSYSLGANNVANVTGALVGRNELFTIPLMATIGGLSIAFGILTFSKRVMMTVGKGIIELDHFSSMITIFAASATVWIYSLIGVPVSSSQSIVGAIIGIGFATGTKTVDKKAIFKIVSGWVSTPVLSGIISVIVTLIMEVIL